MAAVTEMHLTTADFFVQYGTGPPDFAGGDGHNRPYCCLFAVATTLSSAGFGLALIRRIERTDLDCDTAFWFNLGMSTLLSAVLFAAAPWFVSFYEQPELLWLTRCSAIMMIFNATAGVHWALYSARRDFKTPAIVQTIAAVVSMPICLGLAYIN